MSAVPTRLVYYRPIERHWYRVADFVQPRWLRFRSSLTGRFLIWFVTRFLRFLLRAAVWLAGAVVVVGLGVLHVTLSFALGKGKVAGAISRANR
ncbi:hypothetical protein BH24ACT5_BH24ACT5_00210 [soil metagenome]